MMQEENMGGSNGREVAIITSEQRNGTADQDENIQSPVMATISSRMGKRLSTYYTNRLEAMAADVEALSEQLAVHQSKDARTIEKQIARLEVLKLCAHVRKNVDDINSDMIASLLL